MYVCVSVVASQHSYRCSVLIIDVNNKLRFLYIEQIQATHFHLVATTKTQFRTCLSNTVKVNVV